MRTSGTGSLTDSRAGFSLIELVVTTTIISILSLGLVLGTSGVMERDRRDGAERHARTLEGAVTFARDQALFGRRLHALVPRQDGWNILRLVKGQWQEVRSAISQGEATWIIGGQPVLPLLDTPDKNWTPSIFFLEDGRVTPFEVTIRTREGLIRCATDGWEAFQCLRR